MNSFKKCICLLISTLLLISSLSGCGILNNSKSTGSSQSGNTVSEDTDNKKQEKQVGSLDNPVPLGESFSWEDEYSSDILDPIAYTGTYTACIKSVKKLEDSEYEQYDLEKDENADAYLISIEMSGDITPTVGKVSYNSTIPNISGTRVPEGGGYMGAVTSGFDGSISRVISDKYGLSTLLNNNENNQVDYSGEFIVYGYKEYENLLMIKVQKNILMKMFHLTKNIFTLN